MSASALWGVGHKHPGGIQASDNRDKMKWKWLSWSLVVLIASQTLLTRTAANEDVDALSIEKSVLDLLTPLIGDVTTALQGFIDIGKIGMGVAKFISIISDQGPS
ncbi:hypothetical protein E2C01_031541 [Portunus trituberculatus]|uniref:Uncharacterized protein n=1 Tax=Portunus trituberculatus TaxID=210409 RepID=A0A5B7ET20_PORTR|nr:hypothetical protein [Portunus trituberculatus]